MRAELFKTRKQLFLRVPTFQTRFYFRLVANNGEILAQSEAYTSKQAAEATLKTYFAIWPVQDLT